MYVVTGATGNVGREVVRQLHERGMEARAVVRSPDGAGLPEGVEVHAGDLGDPSSLTEALTGAESLFLLPGFPGAAEAARAAGVARIVALSGGTGGSSDLSNAVTAYMHQSEAEVRDTGLPWTFLRPTAFMSNALRWADQVRRGLVRLPFADVALAMVDPADVAAVAVESMISTDHEAMIYRPTGPDALLPEEQVGILSEGLGRSVYFKPLSNAEARVEMRRTTPAAYVGAFFDLYVNGSIDETTVRPTVLDVTGRPPRTFSEWVAAHTDEFDAATG